MLAVVVERRGLRPGLVQHLQVFVRACVAGILVEEIAITLQVAAVAAGDHVDRGAAAAELIEGGELAGGEGRRLETGPVRHQQADAFGHCGDVTGQDHRVRRAGIDRQQGLVEPGVFLGLGEGLDEVQVNQRATWGL
ncbi:hypothetical protein D3C73_1126700 [compost metagenome]